MSTSISSWLLDQHSDIAGIVYLVVLLPVYIGHTLVIVSAVCCLLYLLLIFLTDYCSMISTLKLFQPSEAKKSLMEGVHIIGFTYW